MGEHLIKMPDVGEGIAEAELVEWHVKIGDLVREDTLLAAVMTDKATVEIPSPVEGEVIWVGADVGEVLAVGSELVRVKVAGAGADKEIPAKPPVPEPDGSDHAAPAPEAKSVTPQRPETAPARPDGERVRETPTVPVPAPGPRAAPPRHAGGAPRREGERPL